MAQQHGGTDKSDEPILSKEFAHLEQEIRNQRKNLESLDRQEDQLQHNRQRPAPGMNPPGAPIDNRQAQGEQRNYINLQRSEIYGGMAQKIDATQAMPGDKEKAKGKMKDYFDGRQKNMDRAQDQMMTRLTPRFDEHTQPQPEKEPERTATNERPLYSTHGKASTQFMSTPNYDAGISQDGPDDVQAPEPDLSPDKE